MMSRTISTFWRRPVLAVFFSLAAMPGMSAAHAQTILRSGPEQVSLLELYTSQGCSSCPPADRWLSVLKRNPGLWEKVVPLAFHVDYWDYIGWRDPLAQPEFGRRQAQYAREGGAGTVYTPGMMLNGKDWRGWTRGSFPGSKKTSAGILRLERSDKQLLVHYVPAERLARDLLAQVALLGFDLKSSVTAGENRGRELVNDFIVLELLSAPLKPEGTAYVAALPVVSPRQGFDRFALAAWVTERSKLAPLQAAGGWLD